MSTSFEKSSSQELSLALCERIIPQVKQEKVPLVLAPLTTIQSGKITRQPLSPHRHESDSRGGDVRIEAKQSPLLRAVKRGRSSSRVSHWVQEGLNSARYPTFIYVLDGEMHFRIGVTRKMVKKDSTLSQKHGLYVVKLPKNSLLLLPPEVPFSDASRPHWEGANLEEARSRLMWFHIQPDGVAIHTCSTRGEEHVSSSTLFVTEASLLPQAQSVLEELSLDERHAVALTHHYLLAMLLQIERSLSARLPTEERFSHKSSLEQGSAPLKSSSPVQRACQYMEMHLTERLTLEKIAGDSYISTSYLNRLFREELGITAVEYLTQIRLQRAQQLLKETSLPVRRIAALVGYSNHEHFSRIFSQRLGLPPGKFRRQYSANM